MIPYKDLLIALSKNDIKYLVAGGVAVNLHQVARATMDLDIIVHLTRENVLKFVDVMKKLGYKPKVPVDGSEFADPNTRQKWIEEKNMIVFSFVNPTNLFEVIDVFVREPKPFTEMDGRKTLVSAFGTTIPVVGLDDLIDMKKHAGRDKDIFDAGQLNKIKRRQD